MRAKLSKERNPVLYRLRRHWLLFWRHHRRLRRALIRVAAAQYPEPSKVNPFGALGTNIL